MRVALTGITGFLGSHIAEGLAERGLGVIGVARTPEKGAWLAGDQVEIRRGDLTDRESLAEAFQGADALIANAALSPGWVRHDDEAFISANILGAENTLWAARQAGIRRVVLVSSVAIYRTRVFAPMAEDATQVDPDKPRFELSHLVTDSRYAHTKAAAERLAWARAEAHDLALTVLRPGPIYGPRDHKLTARYGQWNDRKLTLAPTARIPHVHAADVAQVIANALETPSSEGRAYNVVGPTESVYGVLRTWRSITGSGARLVPVPVPLGVRFDDSRARRELGFSPRTLEQGLEGCVAWYRHTLTTPDRDDGPARG